MAGIILRALHVSFQLMLTPVLWCSYSNGSHSTDEGTDFPHSFCGYQTPITRKGKLVQTPKVVSRNQLTRLAGESFLIHSSKFNIMWKFSVNNQVGAWERRWAMHPAVGEGQEGCVQDMPIDHATFLLTPILHRPCRGFCMLYCCPY